MNRRAMQNLPQVFGKKRSEWVGGLGSGRRAGHARATVDTARSLDVNKLHKAGCLKTGSAGGWQWTEAGERVAWIQLRADSDHLHLNYRVRASDEEWQDVSETIWIVRVPGRYGGERPYFICPGVVNGIVCCRRVVKLYGGGRYFLCRHCYRLTYPSQREGEWDRLIRRANKIRARLGGAPGLASRFPPRPKGMWQRTYERLRQRAVEAELTADDAFDAWATKLLNRTEQNKKGSFW
jgi:hypothetical protein